MLVVWREGELKVSSNDGIEPRAVKEIEICVPSLSLPSPQRQQPPSSTLLSPSLSLLSRWPPNVNAKLLLHRNPLEEEPNLRIPPVRNDLPSRPSSSSTVLLPSRRRESKSNTRNQLLPKVARSLRLQEEERVGSRRAKGGRRRRETKLERRTDDL